MLRLRFVLFSREAVRLGHLRLKLKGYTFAVG